MSIPTSCPACGQEYNLADSQLGKHVQCRRCGGAFAVRAAAPPSPPPEDRPRRRPRDDYDDPPPRRRRRSSGMPVGLLIGLILGGLALVVFITGFALWASGTLLPNRVTAENFQKLRLGMTEPEVIAILGPGEETTTHLGLGGIPLGTDPRYKVLRWQRGQSQITVGLFAGRVTSIQGKFDHLPR